MAPQVAHTEILLNTKDAHRYYMGDRTKLRNNEEDHCLVSRVDQPISYTYNTRIYLFVKRRPLRFAARAKAARPQCRSGKEAKFMDWLPVAYHE